MQFSDFNICDYLGDCSVYDATDLSQITTYRFVYYPEVSTTTPYELHVQSFYVPFFIWVVIAVPFLYVVHRVVLEFIIRWRHNLK